MLGNKLEFRTADEAEAVYYEAFGHCDLQVMASLWADGDVVCIHPGSGVIAGYEAVMRSWSHIFENSSHSDVKYQVVKRMVTNSLAVHLVTEEVSTEGRSPALVLATNVYQRRESGWLMVEHHGSLIQSRRQPHTLQ